MSEPYKLSLDVLVKDELDGKSAAIAGYDQFLWKIRSGYAVVLYGAIGLVTGLASDKIIILSDSVTLSIACIMFGFSLLGFLLDYSFLSSKLRVVEYRDKLTELAFERAIAADWQASHAQLLDTLKNAGERGDLLKWRGKHVLWRPAIFYGSTCIIGIFVAIMLPGPQTGADCVWPFASPPAG